MTLLQYIETKLLSPRKVSIAGLLLLILLSPSQQLWAQGQLRSRQLPVGSDTVQLDSLSIVPGSVLVYDSAQRLLPQQMFWFDAAKAQFYAPCRQSQALRVVWRSFPLLLTRNYALRPRPQYFGTKVNDSTLRTYVWPRPAVIDENGSQTQIETNGSISRGLSSGSNQDVFMNSDLNLQLTGRLTNSISVQGAIADNTVPFQPNGNTQQLQDFDKVFIRFYTPQHELVAGDYEIARNKGTFLQYFKKGQGGKLNLHFEKQGTGSLQTETALAVSKGKTCVQKIVTQEANQGPYRILGCNNELYIIILSGSERVYLDGVLLQRGEMRDYVIDYNTGELRFTARRLITKDSRVTVEFEYSDKNYARFLIANNTELKTSHSTTNLGLYTEFDNKNQPYQQSITDSSRAILAAAGNGQARASSAVRDTTFNKNTPYYRKTDTLVDGTLHRGVFVYTTRRSDERYRLSFSYVGANKGAYRAVAANTGSGKMYVWSPSVNGQEQGDYMPVVLLIAPRQKQVASISHEELLSKNSKANIEISVSNNDQNTFSSIDDEHNAGMAVRTAFEKRVPLGARQLVLSGGERFVQRNFDAVAPLRTTEFLRDWNIVSSNTSTNENLLEAKIVYKHTPKNEIGYWYQNLQRENQYRGDKQGADLRFAVQSYSGNAQASFLKTKALSNRTEFLRNKVHLQKQLWQPVAVWFVNEQERNQWYDSSGGLQNQSYRFYKNGLYFGTPDSAAKGFKLGADSRTDLLTLKAQQRDAYRANDVLASGWWPYQKGAMLRAQCTWRQLQILDSSLSTQPAQTTVLTVLEHRNWFFKRSLQSTLYYETGSGVEARKEYSFVEVTPGLGTFVWNSSTDYNGDGIPQMNEFEVARYQYQANYIRVATPSSHYQSVRTSRISHTLVFDVDKLLTQPTTWQAFLARFSDKCYISVEQKLLASRNGWWHNPLVWQRTDTSLQTLAATFRNTVFFNRLSSLWGISYTMQQLQNKQLSTIGFEDRKTASHQISTRLTVLRQLTFTLDGEQGQLYSMPQLGFMQNRSYDISYWSTSLKTQWQPSLYWAFSILGGQTKKRNALPDNEQAQLWRVVQENTFSHPKYGRVATQLAFILVQYPYPNNTAIAYTMLEALQAGRNFTWTASWQRDVTKNIQLNLRYEGQRLASGTTVHAGTVMAKAFF